MPNNPLPVWRLDAEDKAIHKQLACAKTALRKAAAAIREHRPDDEILCRIASCCDTAGGAVAMWMAWLREEAAEKENKKERGE